MLDFNQLLTRLFLFLQEEQNQVWNASRRFMMTPNRLTVAATAAVMGATPQPMAIISRTPT